MAHLFISYSKKDITFARHLRTLLQDQGFGVWMDETQLVPGERWWHTIERNIISCSAFIVIMSPNSRESDWVEREILVADNSRPRKPIFPILLADEAWALLGNIQYSDMTTGMKATLPEDLLTGLRRIVPAESAPLPVPPPLPSAPIPAPISKASPQVISHLPSNTLSNQQNPTFTVATPRPILRIALPGLIGLAAIIIVGLLIGSSVFNPAKGQTPTIQAALAASPTQTAKPTVTDTPTLSDDAIELMTLQAQQTQLAQTQTMFAIDYTNTATATFTATATPSRAVTANNQWTPQEQPFDGVAMVLVPPGCFMMGSPDLTDAPPNKQCVNSFWIDKDLVTNAQFTDFKGQAAYTSHWTGDNRPRESITWAEARDFCALRGARLPTEAEWEYAARGPDSLAYPWGNSFDSNNAVYHDNSDNQTADIESKPKGVSWVGAYDMAGNVFEWTSSSYRKYPYDAKDGRESNELINSDIFRVLRGGAWNGVTDDLRSAVRSYNFPTDEFSDFGFRCAHS